MHSRILGHLLQSFLPATNRTVSVLPQTLSPNGNSLLSSRFIFHELQQPADSAAKLEVRGVLQGYRKLVLGQLAESIEQRLVSAELDPEAAATSFIGLIQGLVMQSMLTGKPAAMRQQANAVFALYRRGLGEAR